MHIGDLSYSASDIVGKSLVARLRVPVYKDASDSAVPYGYVNGGNAVGTVYSYLTANPNYSRSNLWWQFLDSAGNYYYAPQKENLYDVSSLRAQGVISVDEKTAIEAEKAANEAGTWYENLIRHYGPWVMGAALAMAAVKGYFSRPK